MKLHFYPYEFEYKLKEKRVYIYLYGKTQQQEKVCVIYAYEPYFYAKVPLLFEAQFLELMEDIEIPAPEPAKVVRYEKVEKELLGKMQPFYKVYVSYPKAVPIIAQELEKTGSVGCYERDILFTQRFLRDTGVLPMTLTEAEGEYGQFDALRVPTFTASSLKLSDAQNTFLQPKILSIDIETYNKEWRIDAKRNAILMVALSGSDGFKKVLTWGPWQVEKQHIEVLTSEKVMLERFKELVLECAPDIITGYFTDGFDFPYLEARAKQFGLKLDIGIDYSLLETGSKTSFQDGKAKIRGILHLDMFKFIRYVFGRDLKTDSYSLDAVSEELLKSKKHAIDITKLADCWDNQDQAQMQEYFKYNLQDTILALDLCRTLLPDMIEFGVMLALPLFDLTRMSFSRLVESYILKRAIEYNVLAPNKPQEGEIANRTQESFQGAFVYQPTPGLYKDLVVFDFKSLYPTIITSHNIGPESLCCSCCKEHEHVPGEDQFWFCTQEKKFIPQILEFLIDKRAEVKKKIKQLAAVGQSSKLLESRSFALKILANSFYGYLGFFGARWYCLECVKSITAYARHYIQQTIAQAQQEGFIVCYSDTDSCFLLLGDKKVEDAVAFQQKVNEQLPGQMELDFENYYPRGIFVPIKGSEVGAKKKYALLSQQGKLKITGFETVRRNISPLAKEVQEKVLRLALEDKAQEALWYVRSVVEDMKIGKIANSKMLIKTQITKDLGNYAAEGPHVVVARKMIEQGMPVAAGSRVEYIIGKGSGLVRDRAKLPQQVKEGEYDYQYYLHHQILPAVSGIFSVLGYAEEELYAESKQEGLGKFFG